MDDRTTSLDPETVSFDDAAGLEVGAGTGRDNLRTTELAQADISPLVVEEDDSEDVTFPEQVVPDADNVVRLPAGVSLENFRIDGDDLILVQADGTEVRVVGGAANIPTFLIGEIEIPQATIVAAMEANDINVAAGPDGTLSASSQPVLGSGADFSRGQDDGEDADTVPLGLLSDTSLDDGGGTDGLVGPEAPDVAPVIGAASQPGAVDEEGLAGGNPGALAEGDLPGEATVATGSLNIVWGPDDGDVADTVADQDPVTGTAGNRSVTFTDTGSAVANITVNGGAIDPATLTSRGDAITYALDADATVLTATAGGRTVFTVTLFDDGAGSYRFALLDTLDHPLQDDPLTGAVETAFEDDLVFTFSFTAGDDDGGTATDTVNGTFVVTIDDDAPVIGTPDDVSVDEDGLTGGLAGEPAGYGGTDLAGEDFAQTGDLAIAWGADDADTGGADGADQDTVTGLAGNRSVTFTDTTAVNNVTSSVATAATLTSRGDTLSYALDADATTLTATASGRPVFTLALSDDGTGAYTFTLLDVLDHPTGGPRTTSR